MLAEKKEATFTLRMLRAKYNYTQKAAGEAVGVSGDVWHNWENGKSFPDVRKIEAIEEHFGVTYNDIIFLRKNNG